MSSTFILGAGVTGLAAGVASGLPVYEASPFPGGICSSYYIRPNTAERLSDCPGDGNAYRFELGGGHWIFGGDPVVLEFIRTLAPMRTYSRVSSVFFPGQKLRVPYPIQNHLRFLGDPTASRAISEMSRTSAAGFRTMKEWLLVSFGQTLCDLFFFPFHELYTAGLYDRIAPQDAYKSPVDIALVIRGASQDAPPVGYNATFIYPTEGLNALAQRMAARADVRFNRTATRIDVGSRSVHFSDGSHERYTRLISTLPLTHMLKLTGLSTEVEPDPYTSVLVLNIGGLRGKNCPGDHWLYVPSSRSQFHRVGFYSNVDPAFLPKGQDDRVSIYVERAYPGGQKPSDAEIRAYAESVAAELREWGWIDSVEVSDPTWIDVAYTWSWPGSTWTKRAIPMLEEHGIFQTGRYGRWHFQGIADSIKDGFVVGAAFK